jgi:hypothetical protein
MSDLTVSPGYATIEEEFEASLRRAFVDHEFTSIMVDDKRQRFRIESMWYGEERGWLHVELIDNAEQQYSYYEGTLTDTGKKHFGLESLA